MLQSDSYYHISFKVKQFIQSNIGEGSEGEGSQKVVKRRIQTDLE